MALADDAYRQNEGAGRDTCNADAVVGDRADEASDSRAVPVAVNVMIGIEVRTTALEEVIAARQINHVYPVARIGRIAIPAVAIVGDEIAVATGAGTAICAGVVAYEVESGQQFAARPVGAEVGMSEIDTGVEHRDHVARAGGGLPCRSGADCRRCGAGGILQVPLT